VLRAIMVGSVVWTVCCCVQFVIQPAYLVNSGGRFWGMLSNAQQAAMLVTPFAIIALWLFLNDRPAKYRFMLRALWLGLFGINVLFLGWTASRTGSVMFVLGITFVLYNKIGRLVVFAPLIGALVLGLAFLADELQISSNLERLVSTENTRSGVWAAQFESIAESPIIGVGWHETGGSESSYFAGFAGYGLGMFLLIVSFLFYSMWMCAKLWVKRGRLSETERPLIDLFIAYNAMYFGAAVFEGIILGRSSTPQSMMLMFAGIGTWLNYATSDAVEGQAWSGEAYAEDAYGVSEAGAAHDAGAGGHYTPPPSPERESASPDAMSPLFPPPPPRTT
jgi:hypothetical protein